MEWVTKVQKKKYTHANSICTIAVFTEISNCEEEWFQQKIKLKWKELYCFMKHGKIWWKFSCVFVIWNDEWEVHKWHLNVLLLSSQILILVRVWYFQVSKLDKRSKTSNVLNVSPCISNSIYVCSDNVKCQQQV